MRGTVLGFDPHINSGAIVGQDGKRYDFAAPEWRGTGRPSRGAEVDFIAAGSHAVQIYPAAPSDLREGESAKIIYILYLVSLAVGLTAIVGVVMAYVNRTNAPAWVATHYRLQIRTFWIGLLYALISVVTIFAVIGLLFALFTLVWWIVRCAKGMQRLSRGQAYENPATWLW
jgi:uncharacterized membrane protein